MLGVDPGLNGAIALFDPSLEVIQVRDMPVAMSGVGQRRVVVPVLLAEIVRGFAPTVAWVEQVHAMPKQGVSSVFKFGQVYGAILGVLAALDIPTRLVTPNLWKRHYALDARKAGAREAAMRIFPRDAALFQRVKDADRAEAALIACYGAVRDVTL